MFSVKKDPPLSPERVYLASAGYGGQRVATEEKRRFALSVVTALTIPAFLLAEAWNPRSRRYKHWVLTLFVTMYGATISIGFNPYGEGPDGVRHLLLVHTHYMTLGFEQFLIELWNTLTLQVNNEPGIRDPYKHIVSYLTGGVLGAPSLFFTVVAFVYGYFFTGSVLEIFRNFRLTRTGYIFFFFAAVFLVTKNIEGVNTVRTWTGMWILVYACLKYHETRQLRYALLMFVPPFVHFGYFLMAIPAYVVLVLGTRARIYALLFVLSSFTTFINPGTVVDAVSVTERGAHQIDRYWRDQQRQADQVLEQTQGKRWYLTFQKLGIQKWALNVLIYTILASGVYFVAMSVYQKKIFSIGLLMLTMSNSTWYLFAVSNRTWIIGCIFILAAFLMMRQDPQRRSRMLRIPPYYKWGLHGSLALFLPYVIYNMSTLIDYPSVFLLGGPFVVWIEPELNVSIKYVLQVLVGVR